MNPLPILTLSLWWYPLKTNSMTSSCPCLALGLLSSGKQGHQQIQVSQMNLDNLYYTVSYYILYIKVLLLQFLCKSMSRFHLNCIKSPLYCDALKKAQPYFIRLVGVRRFALINNIHSVVFALLLPSSYSVH